MPHTVVYNEKPIEELDKPQLITALEAVCNQLEDWKKATEYWRSRCEKQEATMAEMSRGKLTDT